MDGARGARGGAGAGLDADGDGRVSTEELARARPATKAALLDPLTLTADGEPCVAALDDAALDPPECVRLRATYACPRAPSRLHLRFGFLDRMPPDHRHLATVHLPKGDIDVLAARGVEEPRGQPRTPPTRRAASPAVMTPSPFASRPAFCRNTARSKALSPSARAIAKSSPCPRAAG